MYNNDISPKDTKGAQMTRASGWLAGDREFASAVASLDLLDPPLRLALTRHIPDGEDAQQIIRVPPARVPEITTGAWARFNYLRPVSFSPETILVSLRERLLVASQPKKGGPPAVSVIPLSDILSVELGSFLLFAWLSVHWPGLGGLKRTRIYFNSVSEALFRELVEHICRTQIAHANLPARGDKRSLDKLTPLPYKFKNIIAHRLLLSDEAIQAVVFRPTVWHKRLALFRQMLAPALALLRTNYHILVMHEESGRSDRYGYVFRYFPLSAIQQVGFQRTLEAVRLDLVLERHGILETLDFSFPSDEEDCLRAVFTDWM
jgi:hypothetical protein